MRIEREGDQLRVVLSERNLRALLAKLQIGDSARTLFGDGVFVSAEPDEQHYAGREPGPMHPLTERLMKD